MKYKDSNGQWQTIKFKNYGIEQTPIGSMIYYPSQIIPNGYLVCDGREVLIADYPLLFNAIGYIGGEDVDTGYFRLPDMRGNVPAGYYEGLDSSNPLAGNFGDKVGKPTHTLTVDEMPMHNHHGLYDDSLQNQRVGAWGTGTEHKGLINEMGSNEYEAFATGFAGGSQPHSIVQPTKLYHWLIKAKNVVTLGGHTEDFKVDGTLTVDQFAMTNITEISNCNDTSLPTGIYYCTGSTDNAPYTSAWFLQVMKRTFNDGTFVITQVAYRYRDNEIWMRQYNAISSEGWKAWYKRPNETNCITCYSQNQTTPGTKWAQPSVIYTSHYQIGDKITLASDNYVDIGPGVNMVEICATLSLTSDSYDYDGDIAIVIYKNDGTFYKEFVVRDPSKKKTYHISNFIVSVAEGYRIKMGHYTGAATDSFTTYDGSNATFLTVKAIG